MPAEPMPWIARAMSTSRICVLTAQTSDIDA
jgi:hypothetical protein